MTRRNVFVVGLNPFNVEQLRHVDHAEQHQFRELLSLETVKGGESGVYPFNDVLDEARQQLRASASPTRTPTRRSMACRTTSG